jgi:hypothetical protein
MSIITKTKAAATTIALIAMAAVFYTTLGTGRDDSYVLSAKWKPEALSKTFQVHITVTVDGYPLIVRIKRVSPFGETMVAVKGAHVKLTAATRDPNVTFVDCFILRNNRVVPRGGYNSIPGPGEVVCEA